MKLALTALFAGLACVSALAAPAPAEAPAATVDGPVVVELFSSEGCSSCPPADAMVRALARRSDVIALEYHVDYWDYIGWRDPFAAAEYGDRQARYARALTRDQVVTPQVIVGGAAAIGGARRAATEAAITEAAAALRSVVTVRRLADRGEQLTLEIRTGAIPAASEVMLAITESDLETEVRRGENAGRTLAHAPVVRSLRRLAIAEAGAGWSATIQAPLDAAWAPAHLRAVVFLQARVGGAILGAGALAIAPQT